MNWCLLRSHLTNFRQIVHSTNQHAVGSVRTMAVKSGTTGKKRFRLPANTEAEYLVNNVSGSNIYKDGKDIEIKDDSHYPDWIWTLHLGKPLQANELEYGTHKYWEQLAMESNIRLKRFMSVRNKTTKRVGQIEKQKMEWQERIKYRALAAFHYEPGYKPEDVNQHEPHMKMWLRPQTDEEVIYPDQFVREGEKFFRPNGSIKDSLDVPLRRFLFQRFKGYRDPSAGVLTASEPSKDDKQLEKDQKQQIAK